MSINKNAVEVLCGEFSFNLRGEFESKVVEITPETATKLLSFSEGNRTLKTSSLSILIKAIKENDFVVTNNAISFDENFILRDGHHRLKAISVAGLPVKHAVSINIPFSNFQHVDRGVSRSQSDILSMYATREFDFEISAKVVAAAASIAAITSQCGKRRSNKEVENIIFANRRGLKFIADNYSITERGVCSATVCSAISAAAEVVPHDKLEQFCLMLSRGVSCGLKSESNAALFCRDAFLGHKLSDSLSRVGVLSQRSTTGAASRIRVYFIQYCIQQFIAGKDVNRVVTGATMDKETKEITFSPVIYPPISVI